jgi:hypothetical protein
VQTNYEAVKMVAEIFDEGESDLGLLTEEVRTRTWDISNAYQFYHETNHLLF